MLLFYHLFSQFVFIQVCSKCLLTGWCCLYNDLYNHSHFVFVPSLRSLLLMNDLWVRLNVLSVAILVVRSATRHISNLINQSGVVGRHTNPSAEGSACFWKHQFAAVIHIRLVEPDSTGRVGNPISLYLRLTPSRYEAGFYSVSATTVAVPEPDE